jgi:hypothetical protein
MASGISAQIGARAREKRATKRQAKVDKATAQAYEAALLDIQGLIDSGEISVEEGITRIQTFIGTAKGSLRRIMEDSLEKGVEDINNKYDGALRNVQFNLSQAREDASASEQKEIDRSLREVKELRRAHQKNAQEIKEAMVRRGMVGAPLAASLSKNAENLSKAVAKVHEVSGRITGEIGRQLAKITDKAMFETAELGRTAIEQTADFRSEAAANQAKTELGLLEKGFGLEERKIEKGEEETKDLLKEQIQLKTQAGILGGPRGDASTLTPEQSLKKKKVRLIKDLGQEEGAAAFEAFLQGEAAKGFTPEESLRTKKKRKLISQFGAEKGKKQIEKAIKAGQI